MIRRTAPVLVYDPAGGRAFVNTRPTTTTASPDHSSLAIYPDPYTGDVDFFAYTVDGPAVIQSLVLQWRVPGTLDWTTVTDPAFTYAPGANVGDHHAWILHAEDFVDNFSRSAPRGAARVAGPDHGQGLQLERERRTEPHRSRRLHGSDGLGLHGQYERGQTAPGEEITFNVVLKDAITDVRKVQLYYIENDDGIHHVIASTDNLPVGQCRRTWTDPNTLWKLQRDLGLPEQVYRDTPLEIHVYAEDVVGNALDWKAADIIVRDEEAPIATKVQLVRCEGLRRLGRGPRVVRTEAGPLRLARPEPDVDRRPDPRGHPEPGLRNVTTSASIG